MLEDLRSDHLQFWVDVPNDKLYNLNNMYHFQIFDLHPELFEGHDLSGHLDTQVTWNLLNRGWARLTYDRKKHFLSIHTEKNKNALLSIRKFILEKKFIIKELYLEIERNNIQTTLSNENIDLYIEKGKIR